MVQQTVLWALPRCLARRWCRYSRANTCQGLGIGSSLHGRSKSDAGLVSVRSQETVDTTARWRLGPHDGFYRLHLVPSWAWWAGLRAFSIPGREAGPSLSEAGMLCGSWGRTAKKGSVDISPDERITKIY